MPFGYSEKYQIQCPSGIRFDCSGCSNCCLQWPVPISADDYERIRSISRSSSSANMRSLNSRRENLLSFTHTLEKQADGSCEFLDDDKLCKLHKEHGVETKPSMCRLFPYSFTVTPDTVLASLSFASSAVLSNSGKLLCEQEEVLNEQFALFKKLFKCRPEAWHNLQLLDGLSLSWDEYKSIDKTVQEIIYDGQSLPSEVPSQMGKKMNKISTAVARHLGSEKLAEKEPKLESRPKIVDQIILKHLENLYFPENLFSHYSYDIKAEELLKEIVAAPQQVAFGQGAQTRSFSDIISCKIGKLDAELESLIDRFFYVRLFSKLFFGPGFHHFSLLAGLHHLKILFVLLCVKIKQALILKQTEKPDFMLVAELIRKLERRMTQLDLSAQSLSILEVFLTSLERQKRLDFLAE